MKLTRTLLVAAAAITVFASTPAMAQDAPRNNGGDRPAMRRTAHGEGRGGGQHLAKLAERLNLTDAQKQQIKPILQDFRTQQQARMQSHRAQFEALLTPEQRAQLEQFKAQRQQAGAQKGQRGQGRGDGPFQQLNLTDAQKQQMQALRQQAQAERQAAFQNLVAQVNPLLTEAQRTQLQQFLQERQQHGGRGKGHRGQKSQS